MASSVLEHVRRRTGGSPHHVRNALGWLAPAIALMFVPVSAQALDVEQTIWGFDGTIVDQRFNMLSVLVSNNTPEEFNGTLRLSKSHNGVPVDAPIEEAVFVSPFSRRWVQFYPYFQLEYERWHLSWGKSSRDRYDLPEVRIGSRARIFLTPDDNLVDRGIGLKRLPENLFPPYSTATDGLSGVVLNHVPRWEPVRRKAFLEWLQRGGAVHLLLDAENKRLEFPADLAELNAPLDEFRVGSGRVYRHATGVGETKPADLDRREESTRARTSSQDRPTTIKDAAKLDQPGAEATQAEKEDQEEQQYYYGNQWMNDLRFNLFSNLKELTKPDHNWALIYLMALAYIAMIFPGFYLLGRNKLDYRMVYAAFIGMVAIFSLGFAWVGRRGYGESTAVNSVAIARALPGGAWDTTLWANAFVKDGADYRLTHKGSGGLYSTAQNDEAVHGVITNGASGGITVDIPPYSNRTFTARVKIEGDPLELTVLESGGPAGTIKIRGKFPPKADVVQAMALSDGQIRSASMSEEGVIQVSGGGTFLVDWMQSVLTQDNSYMNYGYWNQQEQTAETRFGKMFPPLVARSLEIQKKKDARRFNLPPGCVRIFLFAKLTPSFYIDNPELGGQSGRVLYTFDVYPNETAK